MSPCSNARMMTFNSWDSPCDTQPGRRKPRISLRPRRCGNARPNSQTLWHASPVMSVYTAPLDVELRRITIRDDSSMYGSGSELQCGGAFLRTHQLNTAMAYVAASMWTCVLGSNLIPLCNFCEWRLGSREEIHGLSRHQKIEFCLC